ncbi:MAG TPA: hypothetical protein DCK98_01560 [Chloroflexi bacterium]|jgi:hypothetical protein|nr:hypothetical protein [Chloroflexota bacterium]HAL25838.1 hypothetical protein [Chloroflexota bacterium]
MSQLEIYIHEAGAPTLRQIDSGAHVRDLLGGKADAHAWLQDAEDPLDPERTLAEAGIDDRKHVHVSRCRRVDVSVRYGGDTRSKEFSPAATINRVFDWATGTQGFSLTATEKAKHTLSICGQNTQPDRADHVGSYADHDCKACFDLAPKERFEG